MAQAKRKARVRGGSTESRAGGGLATTWLLLGGAAVVLVAVLIIIAVSQSGPGGETPSHQTASQRITAPDFQLTVYQGAEVLGGEELQFSELFGQSKPVVLNFWAGLCPPCRAEMPGFQNVYNEMGDQFILLGLDVGPFVGLGSRQDGQNLLRELGITYPAGTTFEASTVAEYRVRGMPTTVFLTADGQIFDTHTGLLDERTFRNKVQDLIQAPTDS